MPEEPVPAPAQAPARNVLVTGGLGSLGHLAAAALAAEGHRVRCLDLEGRRTRQRRRALDGAVDVVWGDIRDRDTVARALDGQDVVVHCAAMLFPDSDQKPELAHSINVGGTRTLLDAMERSARGPALVFASSISVYGPGRTEGDERREDDPPNPGTAYARHKVECEAMIRASRVPWTILRVGAALEPGASSKVTPLALRTMFQVTLDTRIEWIHPEDVGRAMARAAARDDLRSRVLMIGGGPACRARQRDLFEIAFESIGIGMLPEEAFGGGTFEMDWMDTDESQRLLDYQRYTWEDLRAGFQERMRMTRLALAPIRPLVRRGLLHFSIPWKEHRRGSRRGR